MAGGRGLARAVIDGRVGQWAGGEVGSVGAGLRRRSVTAQRGGGWDGGRRGKCGRAERGGDGSEQLSVAEQQR